MGVIDDISESGAGVRVRELVAFSNDHIRDVLAKEGFNFSVTDINRYKRWLMESNDERAIESMKAYLQNNELMLTKLQLELEGLKSELRERMHDQPDQYTEHLKNYLGIIKQQLDDISLNMKRTGEWLTKVETKRTTVNLDLTEFMNAYLKRFYEDHELREGNVVCTKAELIDLFKRKKG